jgi:hypothetical protein
MAERLRRLPSGDPIVTHRKIPEKPAKPAPLPEQGHGGETGRDTSWSGPTSNTYSPSGKPANLEKGDVRARPRRTKRPSRAKKSTR